MSNIINSIQLNQAINLLETEKNEKFWLLKQEFVDSYETLKPINILKHTFSEFVNKPEFKTDILNSILSIATGYLSKKLTIGNLHNPLKTMFGELLQIGITNIMAKDSTILTTLSKLFSTKQRRVKNDQSVKGELECNY